MLREGRGGSKGGRGGFGVGPNEISAASVANDDAKEVRSDASGDSAGVLAPVVKRGTRERERLRKSPFGGIPRGRAETAEVLLCGIQANGRAVTAGIIGRARRSGTAVLVRAYVVNVASDKAP